MSEKADYTVGSGNVFKDLGFDRPDEELAKSDLAIQISKIIQQKGWTQKKSRRYSRHRPTQSIRAQKRTTGRIFYRASIVFLAGIGPGHRHRRTSQNRGCSAHPGRRSNQSSQVCHGLKKGLM